MFFGKKGSFRVFGPFGRQPIKSIIFVTTKYGDDLLDQIIKDSPIIRNTKYKIKKYMELEKTGIFI